MIKDPKFMYSPLEKALEKQTKKQVDPLRFLNLSKNRLIKFIDS